MRSNRIPRIRFNPIRDEAGKEHQLFDFLSLFRGERGEEREAFFDIEEVIRGERGEEREAFFDIEEVIRAEREEESIRILRPNISTFFELSNLIRDETREEPSGSSNCRISSETRHEKSRQALRTAGSHQRRDTRRAVRLFLV